MVATLTILLPVLSGSLPVLVEKPTYSSNASTYGATDTAGYTPPSGF